MKFKVTQEMINAFAQQGSYWYTRVNNSMWFSSGSQDPICAAISAGTKRGAKFTYWPNPQVGILTKCMGGYYMFDLPKEVLDVSVRQNGCIMILQPVEFELPIEEYFEREEARDKAREESSFAFCI